MDFAQTLLNVMNRFYRYSLVTLVALATACSDELPWQETNESGNNIPGLENYDFIIASEDFHTRAVQSDHYHSEFANNDLIGAFSLQYPQVDGNLDITAAATGWREGEKNQNSLYTVHVLSNLEQGNDGMQRLQVLAGPTDGTALTIQKGGYLLYYPYREEWKEAKFDRNAQSSSADNLANLSYTVETDQRSDENFEKSDLLWDVVTTENSYTGDKIDPSQNSNPIKVFMDHAMATIVVKIDRNNIDPDYGVKLLNLFDTASGLDLTQNVHLAEDATNVDPSSPTQLCERGHQLRCRYRATDRDGNTSDEYRTASIDMHVESYTDPYDPDLTVYRAAVPAYQTISNGRGILSAKVIAERDPINGDIKTDVATYTVSSDITLLPGHNYIFTLLSDLPPAIKDVSDEDSWVLDVFDPETNDVVGLLCREYLRYQPDHTGLDNTNKEDDITGKECIAADGTATKYISSQAWVFYPISEKPDLKAKKIPDLNKGTVLRFIYDIRSAFNGSSEYNNETYSGWPYPHIYGMNNTNVSQGIFTPEHGHRWVKGPRNAQSSKDWVEHYMHGGTIEWKKTKDKDGNDYYHIERFILPEQQITNETAKLFGHIAIDSEGNAFVSYSQFSGNPDKGKVVEDVEGKKVAYTREHYLVDDKDTRRIEYPLVKIGYNNFWTSKALRRNDEGSNLKRFNDTSDPYRLQYTLDDLKDDKGNCQAGYLYPVANGTDYKFSAYSDSKDKRDKFPLLYNFKAIADPDFVPSNTGDITSTDRFRCFLPKRYQFQRNLAYFGWKFGAKLMTSYSRIRNESMPDGFVQTCEEAFLENRIINQGYNSYAANISGFNLRTNGIHWYNSGMGFSFGFSCGFWLDNNYGESDSNQIQLVNFDAFQVFTSTDFNNLFSEISPQGDDRNLQFISVRFLMKMIGQDDMSEFSDPSPSLLKNVMKTKPSAKRKMDVVLSAESRDIHIGLIECKK